MGRAIIGAVTREDIEDVRTRQEHQARRLMAMHGGVFQYALYQLIIHHLNRDGECTHPRADELKDALQAANEYMYRRGEPTLVVRTD